MYVYFFFIFFIAECAHPLNKRFHYSKTDKLGLFPRTKLFSPVGLFDLQITDDESDHNGRGINTAAAICPHEPAGVPIGLGQLAPPIATHVVYGIFLSMAYYH
jgi:hypothetical protein